MTPAVITDALRHAVDYPPPFDHVLRIVSVTLAPFRAKAPAARRRGAVDKFEYDFDPTGAGHVVKGTPKPGLFARFFVSGDVIGPFKVADGARTLWNFYRDDRMDWWAQVRSAQALTTLLQRIDALPQALRLVTAEARKVLDEVAATGFGPVSTDGAQTAQPSGPEGTFKLLPSGFVRLDLRRRWIPRPPVAGIVSLRHEEGATPPPTKDSYGRVVQPKAVKRWYHLFRASRAANLIAPDLDKAGFPIVAKALKEAFQSVAEPYDAKAAECDPLRDMADAPEPADVKHPIGRAVLADVADAMAARAPAKQVMFPYQTVGVGFLKLLNYRGIVGDDMGLGKTVQALAAIIVDPQELLPAAIVGPAIVFTNWQKEISRWLPAVPIWPMNERTSPAPPKGFKGIIVTKYSTVGHQLDNILSASPRYLIVDEAHRIKNPQAQQTQAVTALSEQVSHVVLLSGTPIKNNVVELWNLLGTVDPEDYGRKNDFEDEYATTEEFNVRGRHVRKITGAKNTEQLKTRLKCLMIRRLKEQVAKFLPDKTRQYIEVDVEPKAMKEYVKAEKDFANWVEVETDRRTAAAIAEAEAEGAGSGPGGKLTARERAEVMNEASDAVARAVANEALVKVGYLRRLVGRMKIPAVLEIIMDFVENEVPIIVFGVHKDVIDGLSAGLESAKVRFGVIDGGVPANERGDIVEAFQRGQIDVIIGSEAMKEGVTLTRASNVVFAERFWTSADEEQAEDRAHRIGQKNAVTITFPEVPKTIDERLHAIIDTKRKLIKATVGGATVEEGGSTLAALLGEFHRPAPRANRTKTVGGNGNGKAKGRSLYREDICALVFDPAWTEARVKQWAAVNGFKRGKLQHLGGRSGGAWTFRVRSFGGGTHTVQVVPGVTAVVAR